MTTTASQSRAPIVSFVGGVVLDLDKEPLGPGQHELHVYSGLGGVKVYVPREVRFTLEGGSLIGGRRIRHDRSQQVLPATTDPAQQTSVRLVVWGLIGGVDVCRV